MFTNKTNVAIRIYGRIIIDRSLRARATFSTESSVEKLKSVMEDYRRNNFPQEMPSRVLKMIMKATDENQDGLISVEEIEHLLERIRASDQMSKNEIETAMSTLGLDQGVGVPIKKIQDLFLKKT
mmetsp:Transcript_16497/g.19015  ORF Transcript_16497/g.19015 Transcript_16497/m.19015 type:complete len:125 (-) Transcript_16497:168-542(-)|eukprot:CAMPEP_0194143320 /NCGR_PEP_ID=MMETSP0152-20130528/12505_1 /TAXON_ID=1049557 /ORGANISM="Thalassiothrix antarctica, Strain L6-D1" /LENGTH=124 /DNA_ID=CAMNT_0038842677 /DNA_START=96 /DNA_END=470 /DNA_ORIENTATION=-